MNVDNIHYSYICHNFVNEMNYMSCVKRNIGEAYVNQWHLSIHTLPKLALFILIYVWTVLHKVNSVL